MCISYKKDNYQAHPIANIAEGVSGERAYTVAYNIGIYIGIEFLCNLKYKK